MNRALPVLTLLIACTCGPDTSSAVQKVSLSDPFTQTILVDSQPPSTNRGFDGIHYGTNDAGTPIVCSGAEQATSNNIVVTSLDGLTVQIWGTLQGSEDVLCGVDLNKDGVKDVASASEGQNRIRVWYGPFVDVGGNGIHDNAGTFITLQHQPTFGDQNQAWIKLEPSDVDCDGDWDMIAGGKRVNGHAAAWGWWEFVSGTTFTFHEQGDVGWAMQIRAIDFDGDSPCKDDVVITDKTGAGGVGANRGVWLWTNDGSGTYSSTQIRSVNGDEEFGDARDLDFDDDVDIIHGTHSAIEILTNNGDGTFSVESVPFPADTTAGEFHAPILCPDTTINGPFILTFALASGSDSGVVMITRNGGGWDRQEISGPSGDVGVTRKWDNGWCGFNSASKRIIATTEGGDGTGDNDFGIVLFTEP